MGLYNAIFFIMIWTLVFTWLHVNVNKVQEGYFVGYLNVAPFMFLGWMGYGTWMIWYSGTDCQETRPHIFIFTRMLLQVYWSAVVLVIIY